MTQEYTPTTVDIARGYIASCGGYDGLGEDAKTIREDFDRWLAAHDADVLQRAMAVIAKDTVRKGVFES